MLQRFRLVFMLLAGISLGVLATSCSGATDPAYKFREGDVAKYKFQTTQKGKVTVDGETEEYALQLANTIAQRVQSVDDQGVATIDSSYEESQLTVDGEDFPLPDFQSTLITYDVDADGVIQNVRGTHGLAGPLGERQLDPAQVLQFQGPMFREGVLKKGDKWQRTMSIPFPGADAVQATIDYTYEGNERVKGKDAAMISFVFDTPLDMVLSDIVGLVKVVGREKVEGTAFFSVQDGKIVKANGSGPMTLSLSMPSEGGGEDIERVRVEVSVDFDYELQD